MSGEHEVTAEQEIGQVEVGRTHVVLLGAGASRAAFPDGERSGKQLPVMKDFYRHIPVGPIFQKAGFPSEMNFEEAYSKIAGDPKLARIRKELEGTVYEYFDCLKLPDEPTLYDHLILSLRPKDVIATFNWDPFLIQAARRQRILHGEVPTLLFLHGNVSSGFCPKDGVHGAKGVRCSRCGEFFKPPELLYPIAKKNYDEDQQIRASWDYLRESLKHAFMLTIFGYGAPVSDGSAIELMKTAWGNIEERDLEQVEIIDVRPPDDLAEAWKPFIHTHHYEVHSNFYDSWIANHPRRTGEAWWNQYLEAKFISKNSIPRQAGFQDLWQWFEPLLSAETQAKKPDRGEVSRA